MNYSVYAYGEYVYFKTAVIFSSVFFLIKNNDFFVIVFVGPC